jgi:hypothetical protein
VYPRKEISATFHPMFPASVLLTTHAPMWISTCLVSHV